MREPLTPEEIKINQNLEKVFLQERHFRTKNPELEKQGMIVAKSFEGKDVSLHELRENEKKTGLFHGYIANALVYQLGYSKYEDKNIRPDKHPARTIFTKRSVCPHCGLILHGYIKKTDD